jgi:CDP-diacylglycerol--glycerol-3-phosphate 3-phosphatidyltransferase
MTPMAKGSLLSPEMRASTRSRVEPIARLFGRVGLTPNALTVIGLLIAGIAAVAAANQAWLAAGLLVAFGAVFDMFDGALARATGQTSKFGAFLDSTLDRAGEAAVYLGIAAGSSAAGFGFGAWLAAAAMATSFMVSYTRAKSESLGFMAGSGMANIGLAPREIRLAILTTGLLLVGLTGGIVKPFLYPNADISLPFGLDIDLMIGRPWLFASLGLIAVLATITTIQRILAVRSQALAQLQSEDNR